MDHLCKMCVDGVDGIVCVKCTESHIKKFTTSNIDRYHMLFNKIMTSKSHTDNLKHAMDIYIKYIQNNYLILDVLLIEIIISFAKRCIILNKPDITLKYVKILQE